MVVNSLRSSEDGKHKDLKVSLWQNESSDEKDLHIGPQLNKSLSFFLGFRELKGGLTMQRDNKKRHS